MSSRTDQESATERPFILQEIQLTLKSGWKIIALFAAAGIVWAIVSLHLTTFVYQAQMRVTIVQSDADSTPSSKLGALGGLASLAGLSTPASRGAIQFALYSDCFYWRDLADALAKNHALMTRIYGEEWDPATQSWHEPHHGALYAIKTSLREFLGLPSRPAWHPPDGSDLQDLISAKLQVIKDPKKPYLATILMESSDRDFAVYFLNLANQTADNLLRQKALLRAQKNIQYLSDKLQTITIAEHRAAITESLSDQEKAAMVAGSSAPFAAEIVEAPWAPTTPSSPAPTQVFLSSILIWTILGSVAAFARRRYGGRLQVTRFFGRVKSRTSWGTAPNSSPGE